MSKSGVYTITNLVNSKIYIGCTKNLSTRGNDHFQKLRKNKHSNSHLQESWNLYGENSFKYEILEECEAQFIYSQENYWCNLLNTHNRLFGYNIKPTSTESKGAVSQETKDKIRKSVLKNPLIWTAKMRERAAILATGRKQTPKQVEKSAKKKYKSLICLDKNGVFCKKYESGKEASVDLNIDKKLISLNCKGRCPTAKGYIFVLEIDYDPEKNYGLYQKRYREVIMYDENMNKLQEFNTIKHAISTLGFKADTLYNVLNLGTENYGGFKWRYKN